MESLKLAAAAIDGMAEINRLVVLLQDAISAETYEHTLAELTTKAEVTSKHVGELASRYLLVEHNAVDQSS